MLPALAAAFGFVVLHRRAVRRREDLAPRNSLWLGLGLLAAVAALSPGLEDAASSSFAWHMVQHQLFTLVAAPLIASARPLAVLGSARTRTQRAASMADDPAGPVLLAAVLHLAVLLAWHLPVAYDAALADPRVHLLEHATLLGSAVVLWAWVFVASRDDRRFVAGVVALAATAIVGAGLGVVLLSAPAPLYAAYVDAGALDQQRVGGALMKVGALLVHAGAATVLTVHWLQRLEDQEALTAGR